MKVTRTEKIWMIVVVGFYILYNLPFVPRYNNSIGCLIHACLTLIPLWIAIYVGLFKVCKICRLKDDIDNAERLEEENDVK